MASLHGPFSVSANLQFRLPVKLARHLRIEVGDEIYLRVSDDDPGVLTLLPAEVVERRYSVGERLERAAHPGAAELPSETTAPPLPADDR